MIPHRIHLPPPFHRPRPVSLCHFDVVIVGGGAAGLMCALQAGRRGRRVWVIEGANKIGKKILMSGGGRCNFTNLYVEAERYLSHNPDFCRSALARFTQWDFISMVDAHDIQWHEKELGQLFCNQSSKQILAMLVSECARSKVRITTSTQVLQVKPHASGFELRTNQATVRCASLVVASGGRSIPKMGATGWGFELARQFGHRVHPTRAGLVPLTLSGRTLENFKPLAGVAQAVTARCAGQAFELPMLFTHRGISGPAILQISSYWEPGMDLELNLLPDRNADQWLLREKAADPSRRLEQLLAEPLRQRLARRLCQIQGWSGALQDFRNAQLSQIGRALNQWTLRPDGTEGYRTAEVTLGGVDTRELAPQTMESRRTRGLYFIGEVVDVTGHLGGFNFQWAWSSGFVCGQVC